MKKLIYLAVPLILVACAPSNNSSSSRDGGALPRNVEPLTNPNPRLGGTNARASDNSHLGFYDVASANAPAPVKAAASSVFQLRILGMGHSAHWRALDISNNKDQVVEKFIRSLDPTVYDSMDTIVIREQIENCLRDGDLQRIKRCEFTTDIRRGTGFLAGRNNLLWTAAHNVDAYLQFASQATRRPKQTFIQTNAKVAVYIFDGSNQLVLNPAVDEVKIETVPVVTNAALAQSNFFAEDSDYMSLSVSKPIGLPIPIARDGAMTKGTQVYLLSYPLCTGCVPPATLVHQKEFNDFADRSPKPNSDGKGLKVSLGTTKVLSDITGAQRAATQALSIYKVDKILFSSIDSHLGSSGGPVLNANGEVVAVHAGGKTNTQNGVLSRQSRGVLLPDSARN